MTPRNGEVVRQRFAVRDRSKRRVEERLGLRFPRAVKFAAKAVWRLPLRSRVRQAVIRRTVTIGWEAMNRADFESGLALYHPDVESVFDPAVAALGFENRTHGREVRAENLRRVYGEFRDFRFEPDELIYVDQDHLLVVGRMRGVGLASGAVFDTQWANLWTISAGLVVRDEVFRDRAEALRAAGLAARS